MAELRTANVEVRKAKWKMAENTELQASLLITAQETKKELEQKLEALTDKLVAVSTASEGKLLPSDSSFMFFDNTE